MESAIQYEILKVSDESGINKVKHILYKNPSNFWKTNKETDLAFFEIKFNPSRVDVIEVMTQHSPQISIEIFNRDINDEKKDAFTCVPKCSLFQYYELQNKSQDVKQRRFELYKLSNMPSKEFTHAIVTVFNPYHDEFKRSLGLNYLVLLTRNDRTREQIQRYTPAEKKNIEDRMSQLVNPRKDVSSTSTPDKSSTSQISMFKARENPNKSISPIRDERRGSDLNATKRNYEKLSSEGELNEFFKNQHDKTRKLNEIERRSDSNFNVNTLEKYRFEHERKKYENPHKPVYDEDTALRQALEESKRIAQKSELDKYGRPKARRDDEDDDELKRVLEESKNKSYLGVTVSNQPNEFGDSNSMTPELMKILEESKKQYEKEQMMRKNYGNPDEDSGIPEEYDPSLFEENKPTLEEEDQNRYYNLLSQAAEKEEKGEYSIEEAYDNYEALMDKESVTEPVDSMYDPEELQESFEAEKEEHDPIADFYLIDQEQNIQKKNDSSPLKTFLDVPKKESKYWAYGSKPDGGNNKTYYSKGENMFNLVESELSRMYLENERKAQMLHNRNDQLRVVSTHQNILVKLMRLPIISRKE